MKRMRKHNMILVLIILLLFIGIGFAYINGVLKIDGTTVVKKQTWDIHFNNINVTNGSVTATRPATITGGNPTEITYSVSLDAPGDFYEFTVDAVNDGSLDAMIYEIIKTNIVNDKTNDTSSSEIPSHIRYTVTYSDGKEVKNNHLLAAHSTEKYKVRIEFRNDLQASDLTNIPKYELNLKFEVDYEQANEDAIPPHAITVTIDLNGGTITPTDGWTISGDTATKIISPNTPYGNIPTPTRNGYTFKGWVGGNEESNESAYEPLEYIESNGTQYIDLRYIPKMNTKIELDLLFSGSFKPCETYGGSNIFFGTADSNGQWFTANFGEIGYQTNELFIWNDSIASATTAKFNISNDTRINRNIFTLDTDSVSYGSYSKNLSPKNGDNTTTMYLFGANAKEYDYTGPFTSYNMRVYELKLYESNVLVKDYVPAMNKVSYDIGLYDKIENEFYGNIGTKSFITKYTNSNTVVTRTEDHTLVAIWEQN